MSEILNQGIVNVVSDLFLLKFYSIAYRISFRYLITIKKILRENTQECSLLILTPVFLLSLIYCCIFRSTFPVVLYDLFCLSLCHFYHFPCCCQFLTQFLDILPNI